MLFLGIVPGEMSAYITMKKLVLKMFRMFIEALFIASQDWELPTVHTQDGGEKDQGRSIPQGGAARGDTGERQ